jgi:hypothetical protein
MRIMIKRSGGFANIPFHREVDTATLPPAEAAEIERLANAALTSPTSSTPMPDAFTYEVTIDGVRHVMTETAEGWDSLIERVSRSD